MAQGLALKAVRFSIEGAGRASNYFASKAFPRAVPLGPFSQDQAVLLVAGVTVSASPIGIDFLTEMFEDVTRAALNGLAELDHRPELFLVHRAAFLIVLEISAQIDGTKVLPQALPLSAAMLANQAVLLEQSKDDFRFA